MPRWSLISMIGAVRHQDFSNLDMVGGQCQQQGALAGGVARVDSGTPVQ